MLDFIDKIRFSRKMPPVDNSVDNYAKLLIVCILFSELVNFGISLIITVQVGTISQTSS